MTPEQITDITEAIRANSEATRSVVRLLDRRITRRLLVVTSVILLVVCGLAVADYFKFAGLRHVAQQNKELSRQITECLVPLAEDPRPDESTSVADGRCFERFAAARAVGNEEQARKILCGTWAIAYKVTKAFGVEPPPPVDPSDVGGMACPTPADQR